MYATASVWYTPTFATQDNGRQAGTPAEDILRQGEMNRKEVSRRQLLSSVGLAAGASVLTGCGGALQGAPTQEPPARSETAHASRPAALKQDGWKYVRLDPAAVAAETYRLVPEGGCMYGLFAGTMAAMAQLQGEPYRSFPVHMMKYGAGGVGHCGSICGAANGGAAVIGLFVAEKEPREKLIEELLAWYESAELPKYRPQASTKASPVATCVSHSTLCHVSLSRWCKATGNPVGSPPVKERCRRLTADVAAKTVELLNAHLGSACKFQGVGSDVKSCLSCHGKERRDIVGKMQCSACHPQLSKDHPSLPLARGRLGNNPGKATP
jgi:hypothetical protein